jgi:hypothetical protein
VIAEEVAAKQIEEEVAVAGASSADVWEGLVANEEHDELSAAAAARTKTIALAEDDNSNNNFNKTIRKQAANDQSKPRNQKKHVAKKWNTKESHENNVTTTKGTRVRESEQT